MYIPVANSDRYHECCMYPYLSPSYSSQCRRTVSFKIAAQYPLQMVKIKMITCVNISPIEGNQE